MFSTAWSPWICKLLSRLVGVSSNAQVQELLYDDSVIFVYSSSFLSANYSKIPSKAPALCLALRTSWFHRESAARNYCWQHEVPKITTVAHQYYKKLLLEIPLTGACFTFVVMHVQLFLNGSTTNLVSTC